MRKLVAFLLSLTLQAGAAPPDSDFETNRFFFAQQEKNKKVVEKDLHLFKDNFRLIDSQGYAQGLYQHSKSDLIVLASYVQGNNASKALYSFVQKTMLPAQSRISWLWINSELPQNRELVNSEISGIQFAPVLMDYSQLVAKSFNFQKIGDVILLQPKDWKILYRGHVLDDELWKAIQTVDTEIQPAFFNRKWAELQWSLEKEKNLQYEDFSHIKADEKLTQILYRNCLYCHERHESTDYFHSFSDLKKKLEMNKKVLRMYLMPPGGDDYADDNLCGTRFIGKKSEEELKILAHWFENGAPISDGFQDPLKRFRQFGLERVQQDKKKFKQPDLVWKMKEPHQIPADGRLDYQHAQIAGPLEEDLYVEAVNAKINLNVAHHVHLLSSKKPLSELEYRVYEGTRNLKLRKKDPTDSMFDEENAIVSYSRFSGLVVPPKGTVFHFPKGSYIIAEAHYAPSGRPETNQMTFEIFKPKSKSLRIVRRGRIFIPDFVVPAGKKNFFVSQDYEIKMDMTLLMAIAHMHYRGVGYRFKIISPEGKEEALCNVPFYQFKYEISPTLAHHQFLRRGSKLRVELQYDNSDENIANPNPHIDVPSGLQTEDQEMAVVRFWYVEGEFK